MREQNMNLVDLFRIFADEMYLYLDIADIGALYNTHSVSRDILRDMILKDKRIIPMTQGEFGCECNICDDEEDAIAMHPISMNAVFRSPSRIQLLCPWYFSILLR